MILSKSYMYDIYDGYHEVESTIKTIMMFGHIGMILTILAAIALVAVVYVFFCDLTKYQGRKAGLKNDTYAYIPVLRDIYRLDIVELPRWYVIFIGDLVFIISLVVVLLTVLITFNGVANFSSIDDVGGVGVFPVIMFFLLTLYVGASAIFNYTYMKKKLEVFHYNKAAAYIVLASGLTAFLTMANICAAFGHPIFFGVIGTIFMPITIVVSAVNFTVCTVFDFNAAHDKTRGSIYDAEPSAASEGYTQTGGNSGFTSDIAVGKMRCIAGMYNGADFEIESDFEMIIGRDSFYSSIVISENSNTISRKHCGVKYNQATGGYIVTDYSSNGTYIMNTGERLAKNVPTNIDKGYTIYLGDKNNCFKLM